VLTVFTADDMELEIVGKIINAAIWYTLAEEVDINAK
jgi:hypothetical protein